MKIFKIAILAGMFMSGVLSADHSQNPLDPNQVSEQQILQYPHVFHQQDFDQQVSLLEFLWLITDNPVEGLVVGNIDPETHESRVFNDQVNLSQDTEGMLLILIPNPEVDLTAMRIENFTGEDIENTAINNTRRVLLGNGIKEEGDLIYRFSLMGIIDQLELFKDTVKAAPANLLQDVRSPISHVLQKLSVHEMVIPSLKNKALLVLQKE